MRVYEILAGELHRHVNVQPFLVIVSYGDGSGSSTHGNRYGTTNYDGSGGGQDIDEATTVQECRAFGIYPGYYYDQRYWVGNGGFEYGNGHLDGGGEGSGYPNKYGLMTKNCAGHGTFSIDNFDVVSAHCV